jgi:putative sterol carrier protein
LPSPTEIFAQLDSRLGANPAKIANLNAGFAFDLGGDEGGLFHINLHDGTGHAGPGAPESTNVTISMKDTDFVDLVTQKLDATAAFMSGKLKIKGDMGLAMKLQGILRD